MAMRGGAAGRHFGEGYVYLMKLGRVDKTPKFKIGCSDDPDRRLKQIKREKGKEETTLELEVDAFEMNGAETAAQEALKDEGFKKIGHPASDWFERHKRENLSTIREIVENAVLEHNGNANQNWPGYVFLMKLGRVDKTPIFRIGYSRDPERRLRDIQREEGKEETKKELDVYADDMKGAETAAQEALKGEGFEKIGGSASKWFERNKRENLSIIQEIVKTAVLEHNGQN